jgi:transposase
VSDLATGEIDLKKKTHQASERQEEARLRYLAGLLGVDIHKLVFVDESGFELGMTPEYGRSPQGERCYAHTSRNQAETVNLLAALSVHGLQATMTLEGSVDTQVFELLVEQVLLPTLRPGQIVIVDNYKIHKSLHTRYLIETAGCHLLFLPTYSPDLNPIELAFSKLKAFIRTAKLKSLDTFESALVQAFSTLTLHDILGCFRYAGYPIYCYH